MSLLLDVAYLLIMAACVAVVLSFLTLLLLVALYAWDEWKDGAEWRAIRKVTEGPL